MRSGDFVPALSKPQSAAEKKALLLEIVDLRVEGMKSLAANPAGPDAIRKGESEATSLELDLARVYRFGFDKPQVDVRALDQAVKKAVVDSVIGRGRSGGWSPR